MDQSIKILLQTCYLSNLRCQRSAKNDLCMAYISCTESAIRMQFLIHNIERRDVYLGHNGVGPTTSNSSLFLRSLVILHLGSTALPL